MKKPEIKINFLYYGTPFDFEKNFLINILKRKYKIIISDKPDYIFFSVYKNDNKFLLEDGTVRTSKKSEKKKETFLKKIYKKLREKDFVKGIIWFLRDKKILKPYAKILDIKGDFVKIFYTCESIKPDMEKCDWAFAPCPESELKHPRYMEVPTYVISMDNINLERRKQSFNEIKKEKTKFCNFIYSNHVPPRNKFFKRLSKYKRVDSPGACMNNMPPIGSHKNPTDSRSSKNFVEEALKFKSNYKFTIAFENEVRTNWMIDTRLVHPLLVNSIPIYFGSKFVNKHFNTKCFINANDFKNVKELIKHVIKIDNDDELYKQYLEQPIFKNKKQASLSSDDKIADRLYEIIEYEKKRNNFI